MELIDKDKIEKQNAFTTIKNKLNNCIVYRANKFEAIASKIFPYYIPFLSKRCRVKIRRYWRNRWRRRLSDDLCSLLKTTYSKELPKQTGEVKQCDWEWEIVADK